MHVVEAGDSVFSISRLYRIPPQSLREANRLGPSYRVRTGQALILPAPDYAGEETGDEFNAVPVDPVQVVPLDEPES